MKIEDINFEIKKPYKEKNSSMLYSYFNLALIYAKDNFKSLEKDYQVRFLNDNITEDIFILFSYDGIAYKIKNSNKDLCMSLIDNNKEQTIIGSRQTKNQSLRNVYSKVFNTNYLNKIALHKQVSSLCTLVRNEQRQLFLKESFYRIPEEVLRISKRKNSYSELVSFIFKNKEAFEGNSFAWDELNLISLFTDSEIPSFILKDSSKNKMEKNNL